VHIHNSRLSSVPNIVITGSGNENGRG